MHRCPGSVAAPAGLSGLGTMPRRSVPSCAAGTEVHSHMVCCESVPFKRLQTQERRGTEEIRLLPPPIGSWDQGAPQELPPSCLPLQSLLSTPWMGGSKTRPALHVQNTPLHPLASPGGSLPPTGPASPTSSHPLPSPRPWLLACLASSLPVRSQDNRAPVPTTLPQPVL